MHVRRRRFQSPVVCTGSTPELGRLLRSAASAGHYIRCCNYRTERLSIGQAAIDAPGRAQAPRGAGVARSRMHDRGERWPSPIVHRGVVSSQEHDVMLVDVETA